MRKSLYICSAEQTNRICRNILQTQYERRCPASLICLGLVQQTKGQRSFYLNTQNFISKMLNKVKFWLSANKSNRNRFVVETIVNEKYKAVQFPNFMQAWEYANQQLNRQCTLIRYINDAGDFVKCNCQIC